MRTTCNVLALVAMLAAAPAALGQPPEPEAPGRLVGFDVGGPPARGTFGAELDLRALAGDENLTYTSIGLSYALQDDLQAVIRAAFAGTKERNVTNGVLRHGGNDIELLLRFGRSAPRPWSMYAGIGFPDTPSQTEAVPTLGASLEAWRGEGGSFHLSARTALIDSNEILGFGLGAEARLADRVSLVGDYTWVVTGDNTRDPGTGLRERRNVYGAAIRFHSPDGRTSVDLGYSNGTGLTTGFALTPGLGGSGGFYLAIRTIR